MADDATLRVAQDRAREIAGPEVLVLTKAELEELRSYSSMVGELCCMMGGGWTSVSDEVLDAADERLKPLRERLGL